MIGQWPFLGTKKTQKSILSVFRLVNWLLLLWQTVLIGGFRGARFGDELKNSHQASAASLQACMPYFWVLISVIAYAGWPKDTL